jgi:hypothetical protein
MTRAKLIIFKSMLKVIQNHLDKKKIDTMSYMRKLILILFAILEHCYNIYHLIFDIFVFNYYLF